MTFHMRIWVGLFAFLMFASIASAKTKNLHGYQLHTPFLPNKVNEMCANAFDASMKDMDQEVTQKHACLGHDGPRGALALKRTFMDQGVRTTNLRNTETPGQITIQ